ncbi:MAG: UDP-N-acetylmuramate--L-alanine ligase [Verrucomicrobiota bacterium]
MEAEMEELLRKAGGGERSFRVHLIGVAGSGMSGIASLFMGLGHRVSGSDRSTTVETERMQRVGLEFSCPHTAEAVRDAELVIHSSAVKPGNVAYDEAVRLGIPLALRADALAAILNAKKGIVVAGTHGKTTTSALLAHVLRQGNILASHYVGAEIPVLGTNAHWDGEAEYLVAEGDESDGTLVNYLAEHAIILNIEPEHLDFYEDEEAIRRVFARFADQTRGRIFYCADDSGAVELCCDREGAVSYGMSKGCAYRADIVLEDGTGTEFLVYDGGDRSERMKLGIPGRHNVLNALAVVGMARELGVGYDAIGRAMGTFRGAKRRFEIKYESESLVIVDDYGHHPTEIAATIATARARDARRLVCLFQPHRYTRTKLLRDEFGDAFAGVDGLFVTDIYPASEKPIPGITGETIVDAVREAGGPKAMFYPEVDQVHLAVGNFLRPGDLLLTLGAGNVHEVGVRIAQDYRVGEMIRGVMADEDSRVRLYEPMRNHTTLRVGGPAEFWVEPTTVDDFAELVRFCRAQGIPMRVVGRGSNLLVKDGGVLGAVIHPAKGEFAEVRVEGDRIIAGVGARMKRVTSVAKEAGMGGFEWMEGIPGNVGGSLRMNAGAMGAETFDHVESVRFLDEDGEVREKGVEEMEWNYRNVPELQGHYAVSAVFRGEAASAEMIAKGIAESQTKRKATQPIAASAGCIFKNPEQCAAGKLVDELGLKDTSVGAARVSEVHGNFIVNDGNASARDVLDLIDRIMVIARQERGVDLETEVQIIGEDDPYEPGRYQVK